jgi:GTP-binding protein
VAVAEPLTIAIVGRPNVGKSTLFNRLTGRRTALVHETAGTTRDRREADARLFDLEFRAIDTAGLEEADRQSLERRMLEQSMKAVADADLLLMMIDARAGVTADDRHFAERLRRTGKPIVLIANKCDTRAASSGLAESYELGLGDPVPISAEHGQGLADLHRAISEVAGSRAAGASEHEEQGEQLRPLALTIIGQPNAGKSTLINKLLGEERVITGPEPGLTRDAIAIPWEWGGRAIRLIDTAGLRRRAKVEGALERLAAGDAMLAIRFAEIVILLIDAVTVQDFGAGLEKQDLQLAEHVEREGRALVLAANKWDLIADPAKQLRLIRDSLDRSLAQLRGVPLVAVSALEGTNLTRLMKEVLKAEQAWNRRVPTAPLNRWLAEATEQHPPPMVRGRRPKLRYLTQARARPPTFALFVSRPEALPDSYLRFLTNGLRERFGFGGVPLRLHLRAGKNPFA